MKQSLLRLFIFGTIPALATAAVSAEEGMPRLLVQPIVTFDNRTPAFSGKGFYIADDSGRNFVVTSASLFFRREFRASKVVWYDVLGTDEFGANDATWGQPGKPPAFDPIDFQFNYMLFAVQRVPDGFDVLELDHRPLPAVGEKVWFPMIDAESPGGYSRVEGAISEVNADWLDVLLEEEIVVRDQSGCPLISQETGKVVGVFYGGIPIAGATRTWFCPVQEVARQVANATGEVPLGRARETARR